MKQYKQLIVKELVREPVLQHFTEEFERLIKAKLQQSDMRMTREDCSTFELTVQTTFDHFLQRYHRNYLDIEMLLDDFALFEMSEDEENVFNYDSPKDVVDDCLTVEISEQVVTQLIMQYGNQVHSELVALSNQWIEKHDPVVSEKALKQRYEYQENYQSYLEEQGLFGDVHLCWSRLETMLNGSLVELITAEFRQFGVIRNLDQLVGEVKTKMAGFLDQVYREFEAARV
ncbi:hypothetical protein GCM10023116_22960 [Kistimonas scapharcae]|uniref:Uncharacterized protein n=1 Tax=Kistimonas scapharcae TaxID=1036133 RepID=A0ABP8V1A2_9GAMM